MFILTILYGSCQVIIGAERSIAMNMEIYGNNFLGINSSMKENDAFV